MEGPPAGPAQNGEISVTHLVFVHVVTVRTDRIERRHCLFVVLRLGDWVRQHTPRVGDEAQSFLAKWELVPGGVQKVEKLPELGPQLDVVSGSCFLDLEDGVPVAVAIPEAAACSDEDIGDGENLGRSGVVGVGPLSGESLEAAVGEVAEGKVVRRVAEEKHGGCVLFRH